MPPPNLLRRTLIAGLLTSPTWSSAQVTPGVTDSEIVLGQSIYLTGALAELGQDFTAGASAYFKKINDSGGVQGRRIRVITLDDGYNPAKAKENTAEFERQGVFALWQYAGTGTVQEISKIAEEHQIPLVAAVATGPALRALSRNWTFYVRAGNKEELKAIINHIDTTAVGIERAAVLYADAPYGREGLAEVEKAAAEKNKKIPGAVKINLNGDDAEAAAKELQKLNPSAVIMVTAPASSKAFILQARKLGLKAQFYALNAAAPIGTLTEIGEGANGVIVCQIMPNVRNAAIAVVREFHQAMKALGQGKISSASLEGYINAKVMVEGLRIAGRGLTRRKFVDALESMSYFDVGGMVIRYSRSNHEGSRFVDLSIVSDNGKRFVY